jgi:hypothetical protein
MNRGSFFRWGRCAFVLSACVAALMVLEGGSRATAQGTGQGKYLIQASKRLATLVAEGNADGFSLAKNKFSIGGAWLKQSKTDWVSLFTINLQAGKTYRFLAAGDDDAQDVDVRVKDPDKNIVGSDTSTKETAKVDIKIKTSGRYLVEVRLYKSMNNRDSLTLATVMTPK